VEAGAHVQRHEEPAGGDRVLLPGADGRLAGAAAGGHHDEHPCEIISPLLRWILRFVFFAKEKNCILFQFSPL